MTASKQEEMSEKEREAEALKEKGDAALAEFSFGLQSKCAAPRDDQQRQRKQRAEELASMY